MSKYIKPTISLLNTGVSPASASSCTSSTTDAKLVEQILKDMGFSDVSQAFASSEPCTFSVDIEGYCKFSSSIQVFFS